MKGTTTRPLAWGVPVLAEAAALARSVIFARLIGAEELGQAMLLALVLRLVEMISDVGVERLLARAPEAGIARLQAELHAVVAMRGLAMAAILMLVAAPFALIYADGPALTSYLVLGLVPLIRGGIHLDYRRHERQYEYRGLAIVEGGAAMVMLVAGAMAAVGGDHRALLAAVLAQALAQLVLSHLVARHPYRLCLAREGLVRSWQFGFPLILNALLMYLTLQADRLIVAGSYGWAGIAVYGIALQLALLPAQITGRAAASLLAPRFRRAIECGAVEQAAAEALRTHALLALGFLPAYVLFAGATMALVYGESFRPDQTLIAGLGLAAAIRIARTPLSQLSVSLGRTRDPAHANLWRALALGPVMVVAVTNAPLALIAWA
ncbi:MAG: oligosaccharide flippase family protein, partial [Pseudomonadota bacterium]